MGRRRRCRRCEIQGNGQLVYNADEFRWEHLLPPLDGSLCAAQRLHDGQGLRKLAKRIGAKDEPYKAAWRFGPDASPIDRPNGGRIAVSYAWNDITYRYDRKTNTYKRSVSGAKKQIDGPTANRSHPRTSS